MSFSVKCNCGQTVYAEENQRGQNLQCPHCQSVVPVPAGMAKREPAKPREPIPAVTPAQVGLLTVAAGCGLMLFDWLLGGYLPEEGARLLSLGWKLAIGVGIFTLVKSGSK